MLQLFISIVFVVVLIKTIGKIKKEKEYIYQDDKRKHYYKRITKWPYLYLLPLALSIVPFIFIDLLIVITLGCFIPGLIFTHKAKKLFERGYDRDERIFRNIETLFYIGLSALILILAYFIITGFIVTTMRS